MVKYKSIKEEVLEMKLVKKYRYVIASICAILFLLILWAVCTNNIVAFDNWGYNLVSGLLINEYLTPVFKVITNFTNTYTIIALIIIFLIFLKNKKEKIAILINAIVITLLNQGIKAIVARPRPVEYRIINESGYSFPSGHSMVGLAFYGLLIYFIYKDIKNKYLKWTLIILLSLIILLVGISRIYLGVHYTSDVWGGFLFSIAYLVIFIDIYNKKGK